MANLYKTLKSIFPDAPLMVGEVTAISDGVATITLDDGTTVRARGEAVVSDRVFFRDGVIEGPAPTLDYYLIEV